MTCENIEEKTEFTFEELSDKAKEKAREEVRSSSWYMDYGWWDTTYEEWKEKLEDVGISVIDIFFSGFWSQGDGAGFTGFIYWSEMAEFINAHQLGDTYPMMLKLATDHEGVRVVIAHNGRYCHARCTDIEVHTGSFSGSLPDPACEVRAAVIEALDKKLDEERIDFEKAVTEICREYMDQIYRELEQEYDYLQTDEVIDEYLIANERLFDAEGSIL